MVCVVNKDMINNIVMNILHKNLAFGNSEVFVSKRSDVMIYLPSFIEHYRIYPGNSCMELKSYRWANENIYKQTNANTQIFILSQYFLENLLHSFLGYLK